MVKHGGLNLIINVNGVNVDTNTMRTDAEIANLVKINTTNMMTRTKLKGFSVNWNLASSTSNQLGIFDFTDSSMFEYTSLMIEFIGTWSLTAGSSGTSYCTFEMISDSGDAVSIGYMAADRSTTTTISNIRMLLNGTNSYRATSKYNRVFLVGDTGIEFDGTFSGQIGLSPSNAPASVIMNGTINIYGIK